MAGLSRADLVRLLGARGFELPSQAASLGFELKAPPVRRQKKVQSSGRPDPVKPPPSPPVDVEAGGILWRVARLETRAPNVDSPPPVAVPDVLKQRTDPRAVPQGGLAAPWSSLWPRIYALVCDRQRVQTVDMPAVTRRVGAGQPLTRVPRQRRLAWPARIVILEDRRGALMPMARDMVDVGQQLARVLGERRVVRRPVPARSQFRDRVADLVRSIDPDSHVLALSDLGRSSASVEFWTSLGAALTRSGISAGALVPGGRGERHSTWKTQPWAAVTARGPIDAQVERLLGLSVASRWTQPGLLRRIRRCLPTGQADLGTELAAWRSADVRRASMDGLVLHPHAARRHRATWSNIPTQTRREAWDWVLEWHRNLPAELRSAEAFAHTHMEPGAKLSAADRVFIAAVAGALRSTVAEDAHFRGMLRRYGRALLGDLPESVYADDELGSALQAAWAEAFAGVEIEPPAGIAPEVFQNRTGGPARAIVLRQQGGQLTTSQSGRGATIATVMTSEQVWRVTAGAKRTQQAIGPIPLVGRASVTIETDRSTVVLERIDQPEWAVGVGRDRAGAFAEILIDGARHCLRWRVGAGWIGESRAHGRRYGADEFGVYEDVTIAGVCVRFRRVPAGTFMMGSPKSDGESFSDERPQHQVTLTDPFWLADAQVTQALWQAVMGENPARVKGANRPVEQVSWHAATQLIDKVEQSQPGLALRLPTEAQWEYACRAGTTSPRYGELDDVAWYAANSGGETHRVKLKQANGWGLYDMLGNVDEWCSDWQGNYEPDATVDPTGPAEGSDRVNRGGSWAHSARIVRAAYRNGHHPGSRDLGFRLSRGPAPSARSAEHRAEPASKRRSESPPRSDGAEGQARSAGGGASPEGLRTTRTPQTKSAIFSRGQEHKKSEEGP